MKNITLRAFSVSTSKINLTKNTTNLYNLLKSGLEERSTMNDRRMRISTDDTNGEEDLMCDYSVLPRHIRGTILRIMPSDNVQNIPDDLFKKTKVDITTLENLKTDSSIIPKEHYYYLLNDNYLIIANLAMNRSIDRFQAYTNWLLNNVREDSLFVFSPIITAPGSLELKDIKTITFGNNKLISKSNSNQNEYTTKIKDIGMKALFSFLNDTPNVDETLLEEIVSAKLILKIEKISKKNMTEDIKKTLSTVLTTVSETENVTFETKNRGTITGKDLLKTKKVNIDTTETGKLHQNQLFQEMEKMLSELSINNES